MHQRAPICKGNPPKGRFGGQSRVPNLAAEDTIFSRLPDLAILPDRYGEIGAIMKVRLVSLAAIVWLGLNFATTSGAVAQTNDAGRALVVSNVVRLAADTQRSGMFGVTKEFIVPHQGVVRLRYQVRRNEVAGGASVQVTTAIDSGLGCIVSPTSTFQNKVCDLKVSAGDRVRVVGSTTMDFTTFTQPTIFLRNVRLHWNVVNATSIGAVLVD
jgi:hypothetical protein